METHHTNQKSDEPLPVTSGKKSSKRTVTGPSFLKRTGIYGFELAMTLFGLLTTAAVVDYGLFSLFNYLREKGTAGSFLGEITIWIVAAMVVWLPVTLVFYLRARAESDKNPIQSTRTIHKVLVSIYFFVTILAALGLAFAAVYALIRLAISPDQDIVDAVVRVVVPAVLAAALHLGLLLAYPKNGRPTRKTFALVFGLIATVVAVGLFIVSAGDVRAQQKDQMTANDLSTIERSIQSYRASNGRLPSNLQELSINERDVKSRLDRYTYGKVDGERYQLCATFASDTITSDVVIYPEKSDDYMTYANFWQHTKGYVCFKLLATSAYNLPLDYEFSKPVTQPTVN